KRTVLVGTLALDKDEIDSLRQPSEVEVALLSGQKPVLETRPFQSSFELTPGKVQTVDSDGAAYMGIYTQFPGVGADSKLGLVSLKPYDDLVAPYRRLSLAFGAILL